MKKEEGEGGEERKLNRPSNPIPFSFPDFLVAEREKRNFFWGWGGVRGKRQKYEQETWNNDPRGRGGGGANYFFHFFFSERRCYQPTLYWTLFLLASEPQKKEGGIIPHSNASGEMTTRDFPRNSAEFVDENCAFPSPQEYLLPQCAWGDEICGRIDIVWRWKKRFIFPPSVQTQTRYTQRFLPSKSSANNNTILQVK